MKKIILAITLLISTMSLAQDQYTKGMQKAFELWGEGKTTEASNMFERISTVEMDNWLPYYYVAQINTIASFGEKDKEKLATQLEKAQEFIDLAKAISPNNPEIMVQQAMTHTAWIAYDGATYGMSLSGKVVALYAKAVQLAPDNPRVVFSKAEWDMGSAAYFGQDTAPYCKDVERSLELFANFKPESDFHPNWGQDRAEMTLKNCSK
jgi:Asp-tRNA(Asn)/Glu-tRNA(Gln) amidotransferase C subunit